MITKVFTVFDSKAEAYLQPMFFRTRGEALRAFSSAAGDVKHDFHRYAADYTLFEIGEFDDNNAELRKLPSPISLGTALELKVQSTTD